MRSKPATARGAELTPTVRMPNALHFGASSSAMAPMPKTPTVLLCSSCAGKRAHSRALLGAQRARNIARQRQHRADGGFRHRRAVNAVDVGDDDVFAQHRPVDQIVDAGAERLHPFQLGAGAQHVVAQPRRKCQQYVGGRDIGPDLGMVIHKIDIEVPGISP